jgi:hypothetical protein
VTRWTGSDWTQITRDVAGLSGAALAVLAIVNDAHDLAPVSLGCAGVWLACEAARLWRGWPKL